MAIQTYVRNSRVSPRKARLVADTVRGQPVDKALAALQFTPQKAGRILSQAIKSALAAADESGTVDVDRLVVKTIMVDEGPTTKRFRPRAQGRAAPIRRRTSHITILLDEA